MWPPRSWNDITALVGSAEETSSLDFKGSLSSNQELAKDAAAMTLNGGVLVYGVDEDKATGKANAITAIELKQVEEKIRQVVGSRVAPVPEFEVLVLTENEGDTHGVVVVVVPPSTMAPHQANGRYPRRSGSTTTYLEEPEVARLYERRRELATAPRTVEELLATHTPPAAADQGQVNAMYGGMGRLRLVVAPLSAAMPHPAAPWLYDSLQRVQHETVAALVPRLKWTQKPQELDRLNGWRPRGAAGWTVGASGGESSVTLTRTTSGTVLTYPTASVRSAAPSPSRASMEPCRSRPPVRGPACRAPACGGRLIPSRRQPPRQGICASALRPSRSGSSIPGSWPSTSSLRSGPICSSRRLVLESCGTRELHATAEGESRPARVVPLGRRGGGRSPVAR